MSIRELKMWERAAFNPQRDGGDWAFFAAGPPAVVNFVTSIALLGTSMWIWWLVILVASIAWVAGSTQLGKVGLLQQLADRKYWERYDYGSDKPHTQLYDAANNYLSLPKDERSNYPYDILRTIQDPDLTNGQRRKLANQMDEVYKSVLARRKAHDIATRRIVSVEDTLKELEYSKTGLDEEVLTLKELA